MLLKVWFLFKKLNVECEWSLNSKFFDKFFTCSIDISSCPKKGCWVKVITDFEEVFVTFKDYSFFVPKKGIRDKEIVVNGIIKMDTISISQLKHYAYDAGESEEFVSKIKHPKITKSIVADGVAIIN